VLTVVGCTGTSGATVPVATGATVSVVPVTGGGGGRSVGFLVQLTTNGVVARRSTGTIRVFFIEERVREIEGLE
jgi:hypothetical protein